MIKTLFANTAAPVSRLPWIDYTKGIVIVLVVCRHIMVGLERAGFEVSKYYVIANEVVFNFRMPLFFILTGLFIHKSIRKRTSGEFIFTKFDTILYPNLLWATVQVSLQIIFSQFTNSSRSYLDFLYILIHPRAIYQFWFLYALFNTAILYLLFFRLFKGNSKIIFALSIAMHYASTFVKGFDLLHDALFYFMFISIGDLISNFILDPKNRSAFSSYYLTASLLLIFIACRWLWFNYDLNIFLFALVALVGCAFMVNISFILEKLRVLKFLQYLGYYSLYIYLLHIIVSAGARTVLVHVFGIQNTHVLLIIEVTLGVLVPVIIYNLSMRTGMWFLFYFKKPNPLINTTK